MHFEKMKEKYMKEESFFRKVEGWHLATSLQINFFIDGFRDFKYLSNFNVFEWLLVVLV